MEKQEAVKVNPMICWDIDRLRTQSEDIATMEEGMAILHHLVEIADHFYFNAACGLAAPQIGIFKRAFIILSKGKAGDKPWQMTDQWQGFINPVLQESQGEGLIDYDGCLSFPALEGLTRRYERVRISAMNCPEPIWLEPGTGWINKAGIPIIGPGPSIFFQHELDHLNGKLFFDRCSDIQQQGTLMMEIQKQQKKLLAKK